MRPHTLVGCTRLTEKKKKGQTPGLASYPLGGSGCQLVTGPELGPHLRSGSFKAGASSQGLGPFPLPCPRAMSMGGLALKMM
ncbi:hypothetical protein FF2_037047 [Malus domestica]